MDNKNALKKRNLNKFESFFEKKRICYSRAIHIGTTVIFYVVLCIDIESKDLYFFVTNELPRIGWKNYSYFIKKPKLINNYSALNNIYKASDLTEENWKVYFNFIIEDVKKDGSNLVKKLLSGDTHSILDSAHFIISTSIMPKTKRMSLLRDCYYNYSLIERNVKSYSYGGLASNDRFVDRALTIIKDLYNRDCFCDIPLDEFAGSANQLSASYGYTLIDPNEQEDSKIYGVIECPICHKRYLVIEEYTGWHIPSSTKYHEIDPSYNMLDNSVHNIVEFDKENSGFTVELSYKKTFLIKKSENNYFLRYCDELNEIQKPIENLNNKEITLEKWLYNYFEKENSGN